MQRQAPSAIQGTSPEVTLLPQLKSGQLLIVDAASQGGLILCKPHHAEFVGGGAAIGGALDLDCQRVVPIGTVSILYSDCWWTRHQAYLARSRWLLLLQKATVEQVPLRRAQIILIWLTKKLGAATVAALPEELLGNLVGVFPQTMQMARSLVLSDDNPELADRPASIGRVQCGLEASWMT